MRLHAAIGTAIFIGLLYLGTQLLQPQEKAFVTQVIDGDTITIRGGQAVRLLGIDADERDGRCHAPAKRRLEELILHKSVWLERDARDRDKYSRLLRWIWLNSTLINAQLVAEGLAIARQGDGRRWADEIAAAEIRALKARSGCVWNYT